MFYRNDRPYSKWQFDQDDGVITVNVTGNRSAKDGELLKRWAMAGKGIAYKSGLDIAQELESGELVELLKGQYRGQSTPVYLLYNERKYQAYRITALIAYLKKAIN